jgi:hypothetical protein
MAGGRIALKFKTEPQRQALDTAFAQALYEYGGPQCQDQKSTKIRTNAPCVAKCAVSDNKVRGLAVGVVENGGNCGSLQLSPFSTTLWAY